MNRPPNKRLIRAQRRTRQQLRYETAQTDPKGHKGETVAEFLAKGGKITRLPPADPAPARTGPKAGTGACMPGRG